MIPPDVLDLADRHTSALIPPPVIRPGVCATCRNLITPGYARCYRCGRQPNHLDAIAPVVLSCGGGQLHRMLRAYKDAASARLRDELAEVLAAILWRYLDRHERCVAGAAGAGWFDLVATVPSKRSARDAPATIVSRCDVLLSRHERVLVPIRPGSSAHRYDPAAFSASAEVNGASVLLIDDTWTTGATAQSAAAALRAAGATTVALVAVGRHINAGRLRADAHRHPPEPFRWDRCVQAGRAQGPCDIDGAARPGPVLVAASPTS